MNGTRLSIDALRSRIREIEGGFGEPGLRRHTPTRLPALDARLPGGGLPAGALVALIAAAGAAGSALEPPWALAVLLAGMLLHATDRRGGEAVLVDRVGELHPPGLAALGLPLARTLIVRPARARDAPWALAEALRSPATAVAAGEARRSGPADVRRLARAAEEGGGIGLVLAREAEAGALREVPVVLRVRTPAGRGGGLTLGVTVERARGGALTEVGRETQIHVTSNLVYDLSGAPDGPRRPGPAGAPA